MKTECLAALLLSASVAMAGSPVLQGPGFLPGDGGHGESAGDQKETAIAQGGNGFLVAWTDTRTGFGDDQNGDDVYAARLDADGNLVDTTPIIVNQAAGAQENPRVGWNGQNWLVVWRNQTATPTSADARVFAARIAPDGTLLDPSPMELIAGQVTWWTIAISGNGGNWLVTGQRNSPSDLVGVRVADNGTVLDPSPAILVPSHPYSAGPVSVHTAQGQYLVTYSGSGDTVLARRFTSSLAPIGGPFLLPSAEARVASNGTEYFVVWDPPGLTLFGSRMSLDGTLQDPAGIPIMSSVWSSSPQTDVNWDGARWWVAHTLPQPNVGLHFVRIDPDGTVLDSTPLPAFNPGVEQLIGEWELAGGASGGVQMVWADQGCNCPDEWDVRLDPWDIHGAHVSAEGQLAVDVVMSCAAPAQTLPDLAAGDGQFLSVFVSEVDDLRRIVAQRLDTQGSAVDLEPIQIAASPYVTDPRVAWNGSVYMIVWADSDSCRAGTGLLCFGDTYAVRMLPDGSVIDTEPLMIMPGNQPDVEALGDVFLVVARHFTQNIAHWVIPLAMRVDGTTGSLLDSAPLELGWVFALYPRVTTFMGKWLVVWEGRTSHDHTPGGTRYNFVTADGEVRLSQLEAGGGCIGGEPEVAASGAAALIVCRSGSPNHFLNDIRGGRMRPDETFDPSLTISDASQQQRAPSVTFDGSDFVVVWEDMRNAGAFFDKRTDLYGARVSEGGEVLDPAGFPVQTGTLPEQQPALATGGADTLMGASIFRDDPGLKTYRLGAFHAPATPLDPPEVSFSAEGTSGCAPLTVRYTDQSVGHVSSWDWHFGDGSSSALQNPTHVYQDAGTYTPYLTADGGQGANSHVKFDYVTVDEATAADFAPNITTGCGPVTVNFTDRSAGSPTSWLWLFGDDTYSLEQNPSHTYQYPGSYNVVLTVDGQCGSNTATRVGVIDVPEICRVQRVAVEEMSIASNPVGTYLDTHPGNGAESLFEVQNGTAEDPAWVIEHRWRIDVGTSPEALDFFVRTYKNPGSGEDYLWDYSTDNVNFTHLATVTYSGWTSNRVPVPAQLQGSVWVRLRDSSVTSGGLVSVGSLTFERAVAPPPHPVPGVIGLKFSDRESLEWMPAASATSYDVMWGSLEALRANSSVGDAVCGWEDHAGTTLFEPSIPDPGTATYFIVRGDASQLTAGTLDNPPGLAIPVEGRDAEAGMAGGSTCEDMP